MLRDGKEMEGIRETNREERGTLCGILGCNQLEFLPEWLTFALTVNACIAITDRSILLARGNTRVRRATERIQIRLNNRQTSFEESIMAYVIAIMTIHVWWIWRSLKFISMNYDAELPPYLVNWCTLSIKPRWRFANLYTNFDRVFPFAFLRLCSLSSDAKDR